MNAIAYITDHWSDIITALTSIIIGARIIVKLTPTPKDDSALEAFVDFLKHLGLVIKDKAPLLLAFLCMLSLTSCSGLLAFAASPQGQLVESAAVAIVKDQTKKGESAVLRASIDSLLAQIKTYEAKPLPDSVSQQILTTAKIDGLKVALTACQQQYKGLTGQDYPATKNPVNIQP